MPYRDIIVERAILIVIDERPNNALHIAVCKVLNKSSEAYTKFKDGLPQTAHLLSKSITPDWINAFSLYADFTKAELRHAVASVLCQARRELYAEHKLGVEEAWTANGGRL